MEKENDVRNISSGKLGGWRKAYFEYCESYIGVGSSNLQNVCTPYNLCYEIVKKLEESSGVLKEKDFRFLCLNLEFVEVLMYDFGVRGDRIWFTTDCVEKARFAEKGRYCGVNVVVEQFLERKDVMKFDVVIGNPPYQAPKERVKNTAKGACGTVIWGQFVELAVEKLAKKSGYVALIHPAGWRRPNKRAANVAELLKSKDMVYLEMHSIEDGVKTFGATTNYDWYVLKNDENAGKTVIKDFSGNVEKVDISNVSFIPNENIQAVIGLMAKPGEESVELMFSYSDYETRKEYMSKDKHDDFIYPCVYSLPMKGIQLFYSNTNQNGHFGIPKVIFTNGAAAQVMVDETGEYGLTQFAFGIVDKPENLPLIKKAIESKKFIELCKSFRFTLDRYDDDCIKCFRKDFWKEFVNEDGTEK